jgi:hypothetical protein
MRLQLNAQADDTTLVVRYTTTNEHGVDVYVQHYVDYWPDLTPGAYVFHREPDIVMLHAGWLPDPTLTCSAHPGRPQAQRLSPGESLDTTLRFQLPLLERGKFAGANPEAPHTPVVGRTVQFVLHYHPKERGLQVKHFPDSDTYDVWGPDPTRVTASVRLAQPIAVWRRDAPFHRPVEPL